MKATQVSDCRGAKIVHRVKALVADFYGLGQPTCRWSRSEIAEDIRLVRKYFGHHGLKAFRHD